MSNVVVLPARLVIGELELECEVAIAVHRLGGLTQIENIGISPLELDQADLEDLAEEIGSLFPY